jgi:DNA-directed RNA polymerase specialized sigma24 family protein
MHDATDMDLLRQYTDGNSDAAFAALVSRHVDLVYSAALRKTGNLHAAEEITQAVFIILAQKAGRIVDRTILRDEEVTSRSQSLIDVEEIPIFEATAKTSGPWQQILVNITEKMNVRMELFHSPLV